MAIVTYSYITTPEPLKMPFIPVLGAEAEEYLRSKGITTYVTQPDGSFQIIGNSDLGISKLYIYKRVKLASPE